MSDSMRKFSDMQEKRIAKDIRGYQQINSGATGNMKGDAYNLGDEWDVLIDGKTTAAKTYQAGVRSKTLKKEWFAKVRDEAFSMGKRFGIISFSFDNKKDYYAMEDTDFKNMYQGLLDYEQENYKLNLRVKHLEEQLNKQNTLSKEINGIIIGVTNVLGKARGWKIRIKIPNTLKINSLEHSTTDNNIIDLDCERRLDE